MSDSVRPHSRQPTSLLCPWDSPDKNTGVGCHFLLQCRKVKSESEVTQSCPTLCDPMDCSLPDSCIHGIFQARVLEWVAIASSASLYTWFNLWYFYKTKIFTFINVTFSFNNLYTRFAHLNIIYYLCFLKLLSYLYICKDYDILNLLPHPINKLFLKPEFRDENPLMWKRIFFKYLEETNELLSRIKESIDRCQ